MARIGGCALLIIVALVLTVKSDDNCEVDIETLLKIIMAPQEKPSMQLQALRRTVLRQLKEALELANQERLQQNAQQQSTDEIEMKRSISTLARWDNLPLKRNLEALARAGYVRTLPSEDGSDDSNTNDDDPNKRSIASLAKNGQLPGGLRINPDEKRGIESLARNGELHNSRRKNIQELLEELYSKRNIASLARNLDFPSETYGKRFVGSLARSGELHFGKRSVASLARDGARISGKRNVAALLRQDNYMNGQLADNGHTERPEDNNADKRNIASIKAQYPGRRRRQIDYYDDVESDEYPAPVYQNQNYDYEQLLNALSAEKRFLGSVAKSGWFRPSASGSSRSSSQDERIVPEKRHIGALARLGWLPTLRNIRRFNRSGRSTSGDTCRETSSDGEAENNAISEESLSLDDKRFLLQPAVDNILLKKILHPRTRPLY